MKFKLNAKKFLISYYSSYAVCLIIIMAGLLLHIPVKHIGFSLLSCAFFYVYIFLLEKYFNFVKSQKNITVRFNMGDKCTYKNFNSHKELNTYVNKNKDKILTLFIERDKTKYDRTNK